MRYVIAGINATKGMKSIIAIHPISRDLKKGVSLSR